MSDHAFTKVLSKRQFEAATTLDVPVCILAGAGTGKTRVITHRIAYLIEHGAQPEEILGVTFTNKASQEMRARVETLLPGLSHRVQLGTFHGLAAKILRRFGPYVGVPSSFLIYDQDDSQRLMRQIAIEQFNIGRDYLGFYEQHIDQWQNEGLLPDQVQAPNDLRFIKAKELYASYWHKLQQVGALDFNGLLLKWRELLEQPEASHRLKAQYRHILVDEYQDTNVIQAEIVQMLGIDAKTVAIVGDDDQSIYSWRGARPSNMQKFLNDMPGAKLIKLEENYRSTSTILQAANAVIANNMQRLGKNLVSVGSPGVSVRLIRAFNDRNEAELVVDLIEDQLAKGQALNDFAVLMRTNSQSRSFEESLRRARLPYRLVGGVKFYDRKEVKDVLATLRAALNPKSDIDAYRAVTAIPRGIGDASLKKAQELAKEKNTSLMNVLLSPDLLQGARVATKTAARICEFASRLSELGIRAGSQESGLSNSTAKVSKLQGDLWSAPEENKTLPHATLDAEQAVALAIEISGVAERLQAEKTPEAQDRLDNVGQLLSAARQYVEEVSMSGGDVGALSFLEATALLSSADDLAGEDKSAGALTLMTLHAAKGLEFDIVFMVGMEEYGFPHARALEEDADKNELEEERRLAYVGMTRAKKQLLLTYAQRRMIRGIVKGRVPSRFLRELPKDVITGDIPSVSRASMDSGNEDAVFDFDSTPLPLRRSSLSRTHLYVADRGDFRERNRQTNDLSIEIEPDFAKNADEVSDLVNGARVWHSAFGAGTVVENRGKGRLARAVVRFDRDGKRRAIIMRHLRVS